MNITKLHVHTSVSEMIHKQENTYTHSKAETNGNDTMLQLSKLTGISTVKW